MLSILLSAVWAQAGFGVLAAAAMAWRRRPARAGHTLSFALLGVAAAVAAATLANPDPRLNPAAAAAWIVLVSWALGGWWLARQVAHDRPPGDAPDRDVRMRTLLWVWVGTSAGLALAIALSALYLQWMFRPFS